MSFTAFDHACMAEALRLARRGMATTHPNPRVGCVVAKGGEVIASGWHRVAGGAHAELEALAGAGAAARGATVYVTLEPCSHHGRTPPCADALIRAGVAEVIMAVEDPDPRVSGGGRAMLEAAGVQCRAGLMEEAGRALNRGFLQRHLLGRPLTRLKLAQSLDGRIALANGASQWISGEAARADVQRWRARSSAVMTGIGTVLADDPSLDVRLDGQQRQPLRVILDSRWRTPAASRTLGLPGQVLIVGLAETDPPAALQSSGAELLGLPSSGGRVDLEALMAALAERQMNEVQVEAGGTLAGALLEASLVDEVLIYQSACLLGGDARPSFILPTLESMARRWQLRLCERRAIGSDLRLRYEPQYRED